MNGFPVKEDIMTGSRKVEKSAVMEALLAKGTVEVAKSLLGKLIIIKDEGNNILAGYIAETEAYLGIKDMACHSYGGKRTPKVEPLYQKAGTVYIYTMHTHKMLNIVTCEENNPQAVLIRAIEPFINTGIMERNRGKGGVLATNGPGKLTKAMKITDKLNMGSVREFTLIKEEKESEINIKGNINESFIMGKYIEESDIERNCIYLDFFRSRIPKEIGVSSRIGIPDKGEWTGKPLRFFVKGNKFVSGMRKSEYCDDCWE